ncbi:MAG: TlpA disulfide reductase family protein [Coxiellaceae bacterium]|nr:TlpA disulfide reductase family protein [Coxiellaceae bacterium]
MKIIKMLAMTLVTLLLCACSQPDRTKETLQLSDGTKITLAALDGKWVFVNYWATWCHSCKQEMQQLDKFAKQYPKKAIVLGYNYMDLHGKALQKAVTDFGISFSELENIPSDYLNTPEEVDSLPVTFVINPQGDVVETLYGPQTVASLAKVMSA